MENNLITDEQFVQNFKNNFAILINEGRIKVQSSLDMDSSTNNVFVTFELHVDGVLFFTAKALNSFEIDYTS